MGRYDGNWRIGKKSPLGKALRRIKDSESVFLNFPVEGDWREGVFFGRVQDVE